MDTSFPPALPVLAAKGSPVETSSIALIDCGFQVIGVDVTHVREVIPAPESLQPLSSSGPGVVGCLALRGLVVPVIDFHHLLGWPQGEGPGILVVLRIAGCLVAFRAHATKRIVLSQQIRYQDMALAATGLGESIFPRLGLIEEEAVAMLDPNALIGLGIPSTRDTRTASRTSDISEQYLLFELEGRDFLLPVARVDGTVPETEVGGATLVSGPCEGSIRRLDMEIPLINPLIMAGMARTCTPPRSSSAIVLKFGAAHRLALRADRVRDIIQIKRSLISAMPRVLARRHDLFLGVVPVSASHWYHVLDPDHLTADPALCAFAGLSRRGEAAGPASKLRGRRATALLFRAGGDFALPIEAVEEVVTLPGSVIQEQLQGRPLCTISHRGGLLPIFALSELLVGCHLDYGPTSAVIVTRVAGERVGLAVAEMLAIERVGFVEHPDSRPEGAVERIEGGRKRLYSVIELERLAGLTG